METARVRVRIPVSLFARILTAFLVRLTPPFCPSPGLGALVPAVAWMAQVGQRSPQAKQAAVPLILITFIPISGTVTQQVF